MNVDTSVASLQSSGRDSGLDLSNGSSRKSRGGVLRESDRNRERINNAGGLRGSRRKNKCMCGHADIHGCSEPDSRSVTKASTLTEVFLFQTIYLKNDILAIVTKIR